MSQEPATDLLRHYRPEIEAALENYLPAQGSAVPSIVEAMRYSLLAGGKRLRPAMALAVSSACGGERGDVMPAACALEMVHTYSLIHDDLPCMDDDDLRRGRPTNHVVYGEAMAVLAGDALSNAAFLLIAKQTPSPDLAALLVLELAEAAGVQGMIGGQVLDMVSMGTEADLAAVEQIHRRKTGALIRASVRIGAIAARVDDETLAAFTTYGESLGLSFQIIDDILDLTSDASTLGKTAGKDAEQNKLTWPACVGLDRSRTTALELAEKGRAAIAPYDRKGELSAFAEFICTRIS
ncbi:MAG: farnesyl diphosphate synthase [Planctomycetota bacterium]